jgi:hypothetical protein
MPNRNPITSTSGITEQAIPAIQTNFPTRGRYQAALIADATTACEIAEAIVKRFPVFTYAVFTVLRLPDERSLLLGD